jgi:ankyrin repeat protein
LINKGADVHSSNISGETALAVARRQGHTNIIELLVENGAVD